MSVKGKPAYLYIFKRGGTLPKKIVDFFQNGNDFLKKVDEFFLRGGTTPKNA